MCKCLMYKFHLGEVMHLIIYITFQHLPTSTLDMGAKQRV